MSVMYFHADSDVDDQRAALQTFWHDVAGSLTTFTTYRIRDVGVDLDEATGTLAASWAGATVYTEPGRIVGQSVPDATQILLQWRTTTIRRGRFLQGRTFVPGLAAGGVQGGNLLPATRAGLATSITNFLDDLVGFCVWSRPSDAGPGLAVSVTSGQAWAELAVLRRRRR